MTRKRVVHHPGAAWVAAVAGAWLVAAACRTMQGAVASAARPRPRGAALGGAGPCAPSIRVGVLPDVERRLDRRRLRRRRARPGAGRDGGARAHAAAGDVPPRRAAGRLRLVETGDELELATTRADRRTAELLQADATPYRGLLEVRPAEAGRLTVVNIVNLEDYLRGVVPNELSPEAFPQIEALKAQAVAARTYALAHLGDYASKGYDVCATPACQVYRGQSSEHPLTDRAVEETAGRRGHVARAGRSTPTTPPPAAATPRTGGRSSTTTRPTCAASPACPRRSSRHTRADTAAPRRDLPGGPETARDVALLEALGRDRRDRPAEARSPWTRGRAPRSVSPAGRLARAERSCRLGPGRPLAARATRRASEDPAAERGPEALAAARPCRGPRRRGRPALAEGEVARHRRGQLSILHGEAADSHPLDPGGAPLPRPRRRPTRDGGARAVGRGPGASTSSGTGGSSTSRRSRRRRGGGRPRLAPLPLGGAPHPRPTWRGRSRATAPSGRVRDIVPKRLGVSGRVVELGVVGSDGRARRSRGCRCAGGWACARTSSWSTARGARAGEVERFVITGKGWGHGVGLCQVGAFGMAQAGSTFEQILRHYYTDRSSSGSAARRPFFDTRRGAS